MLTRCPACATAFRVSAEQLKVKQGQVRCGQCRQVFNALTTLVDEPEPAPPAEAFPPTQPAPPPEDVAPAETMPTEVAAAPDDAPGNADAWEPPGADAAATVSTEPANWPGRLDDSYAAPAYLRNRDGHPWLWGSAALIAALLLSLQVLLHFRTELSASFPDASAALREGCAWFGLDLALPHKADLLGIETSDLHPGGDGLLILAATLKNRAAFVQAYPHLELTLTDLGDQALLRKVLAPAAYLPAATNTAAGFAANGELAFNLTLEAGVAGASGYRIYLFYP